MVNDNCEKTEILMESTIPTPIKKLMNKLNNQNETELISTALSLLNVCIQLQDKGYEILATKGDGFWSDRQTRKITIKTQS